MGLCSALDLPYNRLMPILPEITCQQCGHRWKPRQEAIRSCPRCKSTRWDGRERRKTGRKVGSKGGAKPGPRLNAEGLRRCLQCEQSLPLDAFPITGKTPSGHPHYASYCRPCFRERTGRYYRSYREKHAAEFRQYEHQYYEANKEQLLAERRARRHEQREKWREYDRQRTPERRHTEAVRETRRKAMAFRYSKVRTKKIDPKTIRERDSDICYLCLLSVTDDNWTLDHVIPLKRGGLHTEENLKVAHIHCNSRKSNKLLEELPLRADGSYDL